ncbi:hypothetical protein RMK04_RS18635 [Escherichia coli]
MATIIVMAVLYLENHS